MPIQVVGRQHELETVARFLERRPERPGALVFEGQAGIGKSTLWRAAVDLARERGFRVLVSQPAQAEQHLPNVVLGDLLGDLPAAVLDDLSEPRRRALDAALLHADVQEPVDPLALNVAVRSVLGRLAEPGPLVVAIDDEQWLDRSSRAALRFAIRRLAAAPLALLLARRAAESEAEALELDLDDRDVDRIAVGPVSVGALQSLVAEHLGTALRRRDALRVHEASGGNPFYAIELARSVSALATEPDPGAPLPLPSTLEAVVGDRLEGLDDDVAELLLLVAAAGRLPADVRARLDVADATMDRAISAGLLHRTGTTIVFSHPLLASAVYRRAGEAERRAAQARLAAASVDPVERSRRQALAAAGLDPALAAELERQARLVWQRGQAFAAAELAEHAVWLSPPEARSARHARTLFAARTNLAAGNAERARTLSEQLLADAAPGRQRAEALLLASELTAPGAVVGVLEEALVEAAGATELEAATHAALAAAGRIPRGRVWSEEHAELALALADRLDDAALRTSALAGLVSVRFDRGSPDALALAERAYDLGRTVEDRSVDRAATLEIAHVLAWSGDLVRARAVIEQELGRWSGRDEHARQWLLWYLALVELWAGRWDTAETHARESAAIGAEYGVALPQHHLPLAMLALHRGDFEAARAASHRALTLVDEHRLPAHQAVVAMADAWSGDLEQALEGFARAEAAADVRGQDEPSLRSWRGEYVEALTRAGRTAEGLELLEPWEAAANRLGRLRQSAQAQRARGHIAGAQGETEAAQRILEQAVTAHAVAGDPFGQARASLDLGVARRRARKKAAAREALDAAVAGFDRLGAASWAAAARDELGRIGGRQRTAGLSESELRVAELVAAGRTNREIARELYLGERTVASHLTHVYAKLGLRSRTELAAQLLSGEDRNSASTASNLPTS